MRRIIRRRIGMSWISILRRRLILIFSSKNYGTSSKGRLPLPSRPSTTCENGKGKQEGTGNWEGREKRLTENRRRAEMPIYSFVKHQRETETTSVYSPHVLILEGILALHDPRILDLLDMKVSWVFSHVRLPSSPPREDGRRKDGVV